MFSPERAVEWGEGVKHVFVFFLLGGSNKISGLLRR